MQLLHLQPPTTKLVEEQINVFKALDYCVIEGEFVIAALHAIHNKLVLCMQLRKNINAKVFIHLHLVKPAMLSPTVYTMSDYFVHQELVNATLRVPLEPIVC